MQLFNANNLRKTTLGNVEYGGVTYVLNKQAMKGRLFWEAFDAGVTEMYITCSPCCCHCLPPLLPAACCLLPAACCLLLRATYSLCLYCHHHHPNL
jgi:hypothetical protein